MPFNLIGDPLAYLQIPTPDEQEPQSALQIQTQNALPRAPSPAPSLSGFTDNTNQSSFSGLNPGDLSLLNRYVRQNQAITGSYPTRQALEAFSKGLIGAKADRSLQIGALNLDRQRLAQNQAQFDASLRQRNREFDVTSGMQAQQVRDTHAASSTAGIIDAVTGGLSIADTLSGGALSDAAGNALSWAGSEIGAALGIPTAAYIADSVAGISSTASSAAMNPSLYGGSEVFDAAGNIIPSALDAEIAGVTDTMMTGALGSTAASTVPLAGEIAGSLFLDAAPSFLEAPGQLAVDAGGSMFLPEATTQAALEGMQAGAISASELAGESVFNAGLSSAADWVTGSLIPVVGYGVAGAGLVKTLGEVTSAMNPDQGYGMRLPPQADLVNKQIAQAVAKRNFLLKAGVPESELPKERTLADYDPYKTYISRSDPRFANYVKAYEDASHYKAQWPSTNYYFYKNGTGDIRDRSFPNLDPKGGELDQAYQAFLAKQRAEGVPWNETITYSADNPWGSANPISEYGQSGLLANYLSVANNDWEPIKKAPGLINQERQARGAFAELNFDPALEKDWNAYKSQQQAAAGNYLAAGMPYGDGSVSERPRDMPQGNYNPDYFAWVKNQYAPEQQADTGFYTGFDIDSLFMI